MIFVPELKMLRNVKIFINNFMSGTRHDIRETIFKLLSSAIIFFIQKTISYFHV